MIWIPMAPNTARRRKLMIFMVIPRLSIFYYIIIFVFFKICYDTDRRTNAWQITTNAPHRKNRLWKII